MTELSEVEIDQFLARLLPVLQPGDIARGQLSRRQVETLLKPINPRRVMNANGQSHVPAYDVAAHLTRVLGFGGWDKTFTGTGVSLVFEESTMTKGSQGREGRAAWAVCYSCDMRLTIRNAQGQTVAVWEDTACGSSTQPQRGEAHDMARKSAVSYALKRCAAFGLGDQFGLSLYNKGATGILIGRTLAMPDEPEATTPGPDLEAHVEPPQSLGNDETQETVDATEEVVLVGHTVLMDRGELAEDLAAAARGSEIFREALGETSSSHDAEADPFHLEDPDYDPSLFQHPDEAPTPDAPLGESRTNPSAGAYATPIKPGQIKRIHVLKGQLGLEDTKYRAWLSHTYGVDTSKDLSQGNADDAIAYMVSRLQQVPA